jgi:transketolase
VIEPCGPEQIGAALTAALDYDGPVYLRLSIARAKPDETTPLIPFELGRGLVAREGGDVAILACGSMVGEALAAADLLAGRGISASVANMASLKPFDGELVERLARSHPAMITAENHSVIGGLGSATAETLALAGVATRFAMIGVRDVFAEGGTTPYLMEKYGLTARHIAERAVALLGRR